MGPYKKHWFALITICILMFGLLGWFGADVYRSAPPMPSRVTAIDGGSLGGKLLFTGKDILDGQTA